jgi:hypothetical protein
MLFRRATAFKPLNRKKKLSIGKISTSPEPASVAYMLLVLSRKDDLVGERAKYERMADTS